MNLVRHAEEYQFHQSGTAGNTESMSQDHHQKDHNLPTIENTAFYRYTGTVMPHRSHLEMICSRNRTAGGTLKSMIRKKTSATLETLIQCRKGLD